MPTIPDHSEPLRNIGALEAAEQRAYERGQASARLLATVDSHEQRLNAINGSIGRAATATETLAEGLSSLKAAFEQNMAVVTARAEDAKVAAQKQVSTRQFYLGLIGAVAAIGGILTIAINLGGH